MFNFYSITFIFIIISNLITRIYCALIAPFTEDQVIIFNLGAQLYKTGEFPLYGARATGVESATPGALQGFLVALPFWIFGSHPWAPVVFLAILNFIASLLIYYWYKRLFPTVHSLMLLVFILFAPWSLLYVPLWNPSYLPLFFILFFWGLLKLFDSPKSFSGSFLISFSLLCCLQLHLSVVLMGLTLAVALIFRFLTRVNFKGFITGVIAGGIGYVPFLLNYGSLQKTTHSVQSAIAFNFERILEFPKFFFRYLSFPTGDTLRFLGQPHGYVGSIKVFQSDPYLLIFLVPGIIGTVYLIWVGLKYFFLKEFWKSIHFPKKTKLDKFHVISLLLPFLSFALYFFSPRGPSAHTFWILFPLSFFPVLYYLTHKTVLLKKLTAFKVVVFVVYVFSSVFYSVVGHRINTTEGFWDAYIQASQFEQPINSSFGVRSIHQFIHENNNKEIKISNFSPL